MSEPIISRLRAGTSAAHQRMEDRIDIQRRLTNPEEYHELLRHFLGIYLPLEEALTALPGWPSHGYDPSERRKVGWLQADVEALGDQSRELAALPLYEGVSPMRSLEEGFGCAYVLEGATLGGRTITKMLDDSGIPENARAFFRGYGPETGEKWKNFLASLDEFAQQSADQDAIVASAVRVFNQMEEWVCRETASA